jgi:TDG/mug DNA glycosylase family protein
VRGLTEPVLPDILASDLQIVFCGSAAGAASSRAGAYYAGPGNKFWPILHRIGLTPRLFAPHEFSALPDFGIGLTDLAKHAAGSDASLPPGADDPAGLFERISRFKPALLAFNGKRSSQVFLKHYAQARSVDYGLQPSTIGDTKIFVLPSTSGAANGFWDEAPWYALADCAKTV